MNPHLTPGIPTRRSRPGLPTLLLGVLGLAMLAVGTFILVLTPLARIHIPWQSYALLLGCIVIGATLLFWSTRRFRKARPMGGSR